MIMTKRPDGCDHDDSNDDGPRSMLDGALEHQFFQEREIFMDQEFNEQTVNAVSRRLLFLTRAAENMIGTEADGRVLTAEDFRVTLHINSYGGSVYEFMRLYDLIHAAPFVVDSVIHGKAMSAGAFLAMSCTGTRYAYPNSTIMVHGLNTVQFGTYYQIKNETEECDRLMESFMGIVQENTGMTRERIEEIFKKDTYFTAKQAKKTGLVDKIIQSKHAKRVAKSASKKKEN